MNSRQAKQIDLPKLLTKLGHQPTAIKKGGYEYWYQSPFRKEKDASFHTSYLGGKWIWNDFGDIGGTVIDFVMRYKQLNSVREALNYLDTLYSAQSSKNFLQASSGQINTANQSSLFSFQQQSPPKEGENLHLGELKFIRAHQVKNLAIYSYLRKRRIPDELTDRYLREVRYENIKTGKEFFAFGMKNRTGGYEIRAATDDYPFKSALIVKDISVHKGMRKHNNSVNIFEGMLDFLSLLVMFKTQALSGDSIVMHSLSSFQACVDAIESMDYEMINLFLDNNKAGKEHTRLFLSHFGSKAISQSHLFEPYEDINDALVANAVLNIMK